jgi:hypothetical protein
MTIIVHGIKLPVPATQTNAHLIGDKFAWSGAHKALMSRVKNPICILRTINSDGTVDVEMLPGEQIPADWTGLMCTRAISGLPTTQHYVYQSALNFTAAITPTLGHERDSNGSLICTGSCRKAYPYAEPPAEGQFVCYGCRVRM